MLLYLRKLHSLFGIMNQLAVSKAVYTLTILPFANSSRRVARVHTASTASGSSGTLRPHQDVFAVDANGSRRLGSAV